MTPDYKQAAQDIIDKYKLPIGEYYNSLREDQAKACAILHCNGIIEEYEESIIPSCAPYDEKMWERKIDYWKNIITEIENQK